MENNAFSKLNSIDVSRKVEKKNGLTYLSWAWAWGELKKVCPNAKYTIYENSLGWNYHTDGKTCWVKTGVEVDGLEYIEYLPVMDFRNKSISADNITSFDVNKTIQRSLTKAVARHGLGLYIYAGEDLPEQEKSNDLDISEEEKEKLRKCKDMLTLGKESRALFDKLGKKYSRAIVEVYEEVSKKLKGGKNDNI